MPRAGRPVMRSRQRGVARRFAHSAARWTALVVASGQQRNAVPTCTTDAPSANAASTPARVGDAARGDHRDAHGADDLRQQREGADLQRSGRRSGTWPRWPPASRPCAMTASTPRALEPERLLDRRRAGRGCALRSPARARAGLVRKPEMEADDMRPELLDERPRCVASNGCAPAPARDRGEVEAELAVVRRESAAPRGLARRVEDAADGGRRS